jgi:hypothetical protein
MLGFDEDVSKMGSNPGHLLSSVNFKFKYLKHDVSEAASFTWSLMGMK